MRALRRCRAAPVALSLAAAALGLVVGLCPRPAGSAECRATLEDTLVEARLDEAGDIRLSDGRTVRVAGIALTVAGAAPTAEVLALLREALAAGPVRVAPLAGRPDRWGRWPALVVFPEDDAAAGLGERLLETGLGVARPEPMPAPCLAALRRAEAAARAARAGAWAPGGLPLSAGDGARLRELAGRFVVVEGRIRSARSLKSQSFLNFGTIGSETLTVVLATRALRKFEASGKTWAMLAGRTVRIRGVVTDRGRPVMVLDDPEELEVLE